MHSDEKITLCDAAKYYDGIPVWEHLNLSFEKKRIHIIMGESGAGKTTLLRLLMGLEKPDKGEIKGLEGMRQAAVFQEDRLCENLSVSLNIRLPLGRLSFSAQKDLQKKISRNLEQIGLSKMAGRPVFELSGGMKRRVAILRAVMCDSELLFFDEPLKGLDDENKKRMMKFMLPYLENKTVFWITHDKADLDYFPKASILELS